MADAHYMSEMCVGILVAATDYDHFEGQWTLELADTGERCNGMGHWEMVTQQGEIVLRDERDCLHSLIMNIFSLPFSLYFHHKLASASFQD